MCDYRSDYPAGDTRKAKEEELQAVMKQLEKKYSSLQITQMCEKLGNKEVTSFIFQFWTLRS